MDETNNDPIPSPPPFGHPALVFVERGGPYKAVRLVGGETQKHAFGPGLCLVEPEFWSAVRGLPGLLARKAAGEVQVVLEDGAQWSKVPRRQIEEMVAVSGHEPTLLRLVEMEYEIKPYPRPRVCEALRAALQRVTGAGSTSGRRSRGPVVARRDPREHRVP